jgi:hypothetical protein
MTMASGAARRLTCWSATPSTGGCPMKPCSPATESETRQRPPLRPIAACSGIRRLPAETRHLARAAAIRRPPRSRRNAALARPTTIADVRRKDPIRQGSAQCDGAREPIGWVTASTSGRRRGQVRRPVMIQARESKSTPLRAWWATSVARSRSAASSVVAGSRLARRSLACLRPSTAS